MAILSVRISEEELERLRREARDRGMKVSRLVREKLAMQRPAGQVVTLGSGVTVNTGMLQWSMPGT